MRIEVIDLDDGGFRIKTDYRHSSHSMDRDLRRMLERALEAEQVALEKGNYNFVASGITLSLREVRNAAKETIHEFYTLEPALGVDRIREWEPLAVHFRLLGNAKLTLEEQSRVCKLAKSPGVAAVDFIQDTYPDLPPMQRLQITLANEFFSSLRDNIAFRFGECVRATLKNRTLR